MGFLGKIMKGVAKASGEKLFFGACRNEDLNQVMISLQRQPGLAASNDNNGATGLLLATITNNYEIVRVILGYDYCTKVIVNTVEPLKYFSPLLCAVNHGNVALVNLLLESGANPNIQNINGVTPLHNAAYFDYPEIGATLMQAGGSLILEDKSGASPLDVIATVTDSRFKEMLLRMQQELEEEIEVEPSPLLF